jgi:branched-chain amino acid transport system ATP-binding protein
MSLLEVRDLDARHGLLQAVRGVSLTIEEGEIFALVGANGAGKTTLLRTIAGAHTPTAGSIRFDGADVSGMRSFKRVQMGIAMVPEGRRLFTGLTVEENLKVAGASCREGAWDMERVLTSFPLLRGCLKRRGGDLSGGQQQATAIGRALMTNPRVLLLDEVSLGLAPIAVDQVYDSLRNVIAGGATIVLVEQELGRALLVATRVACMLEGRIVMERPATLPENRSPKPISGFAEWLAGLTSRVVGQPSSAGRSSGRLLRTHRLWTVFHVWRYARHQPSAWQHRHTSSLCRMEPRRGLGNLSVPGALGCNANHGVERLAIAACCSRTRLAIGSIGSAAQHIRSRGRNRQSAFRKIRRGYPISGTKRWRPRLRELEPYR